MHRLPADQKSDFEIRNQLEQIELAAQLSQTLTYLLVSIASVSLMVGGVGIMNIMLVSVIERTREIGIRRAVPTRRDIACQFVVEALALCALGAAFGLLTGLAACHLGATCAGWPIAITAPALALSTACALTVGIVFGLYPALRAARLTPVEALQWE